MALDEFNDFLNDTVTVEPLVSRDGYGTPTYGAAVSYQCRVSGNEIQVADVSGVVRATKATIYIMGNPTINPADRLTMPAGFFPQQPPMIGVNTLSDENGPHHVEILV